MKCYVYVLCVSCIFSIIIRENNPHDGTLLLKVLYTHMERISLEKLMPLCVICHNYYLCIRDVVLALYVGEYVRGTRTQNIKYKRDAMII